MKKEPNIKQKEAFKVMLENGGKLQPAMEKVGYSKAYSKNPDKLKKTKGWKSLMRKYLPDSLLVRVTKEGLNATKPIGALVLIRNGADGRAEEILKDDEGMIEVADHPTRQRFLETALKMKGKLTEKTDITSKGEKILVMPSELINKYDISSDTKGSSK